MPNQEDGAAAAEYGLLAALIAAIIVAVVTTLGTKVKAGFTTVCNAPTGRTKRCQAAAQSRWRQAHCRQRITRIR